MLVMIFTYFLWILYSFFEGVREANSKHHKEFSRSSTDIKGIIFTLQRTLVLFIVNMHLFAHISWWSILTLISMGLLFPYIHNNTYLIIRHKLNPVDFPKCPNHDCEDKDDEPTMYVKYKFRWKLAVLAITIQVIICVLK